MQTNALEQLRISKPNRNTWVDVVRGLGIILVFYGHYIQRGIDTHNASAVEQFRFIYSFHMPLFFILSGFFFRPTLQTLARIRQLALRRIIPVMVFSLILLPIWFRYELKHHLPFQRDITGIVYQYLDGLPVLNWVTWFLVCLFVCECLAVLVLSRLQGLKNQLLAAVLLLGTGLLFCSYSTMPEDGWLYALGRTWFLSEALVALGFYMIGYAVFPYLNQLTEHRRLCAIIFIFATGIVVLSYRLNHPHSIAVMMAARDHGNAIYFVFTALIGSLAVFSLAIFIKTNMLLQVIGRNSLVLLGLNGLFFNYIDPRFLTLIIPADSQLTVVLDSALVTAMSLVSCVPFVYFLNRYIPQLVGNIKASGPLLPALDK